mgnify:CR=1 FL=1
MASGLSNNDKSKVREQCAQGLVGRDALLEAESAAYHGAGTCTFYGTANSNQMLLEAMGLHVPGAAFVHPHADCARRSRARRCARVLAHRAGRARSRRSAGWSTSACIVNAMVALLATGGSTNHLIHWVAVARAAGIVIDWTDFAELSRVVPLLARVYPNGSADVNQFQAAGGPGFVIRELLDAGLHARRRAHRRAPAACAAYTRVARRGGAHAAAGATCRAASGDDADRCAAPTSRSAPTAACSCSTATSAAR